MGDDGRYGIYLDPFDKILMDKEKIRARKFIN